MPSGNLTITLEFLDQSEWSRLTVVNLEGREGLNELYSFSVSGFFPTLPDPNLDPTNLIWERVALHFEGPPGYEYGRTLSGRVTAVAETGLPPTSGADAMARVYRVVFAPQHVALTKTARSRTYRDRTFKAILKELLEDAGLVENTDFVLNVTDFDVDFMLQYEEADWNFLCRLCEDAGCAFYFKQGNTTLGPGQECLAIVDSNTGLPIETTASGDAPTLAFHSLGGVSPDNQLYELDRKSALVSRTCTVDDYDYNHPLLNLAVSKEVHANGQGTLSAFGTHHQDTARGGAVAEARAKEELLSRERLNGKTHMPLLAPGAPFTIEDHPSGLPTQRTLWLEHHVDEYQYSNRFESVAESLVYRPGRHTPRPRIGGLLHATVNPSASSADQPDIDAEGRYVVSLKCDTRSGGCTVPIRKLQPFSGAGFGMHTPLQANSEVMIAFVNQDPDRPVIVGAAPNKLTQSPVNSGNSDRSVLATARGTTVVVK